MAATTTTTTRSGQIVLFMLVALVSLAESQVVNFGRCSSNMTTIQNVTLDDYVGRWYEYSKYPFIFELGSKCVYASYNESSDGLISVYNFGRNRLTSSIHSVSGTATVNEPGKWTVKFQNVPVMGRGSNYWILDTDYRNYAVVYSCSDVLGILKAQVVWILTRDRFPSQETVETAQMVISANGLSLKPLRKTDQQNCPADD